MRYLWGRLLLCVLGSALLVVSNGYGQQAGSANAPRALQPNREEQAQAAAEKEAIAESIIAREEAASGRAFDPAFRADAKNKLASRPFNELESIHGLSSGLGIKAYGSSQADLVYVPVTPCRIIDTRVAGGAIAMGATRDFLVAAANYSSQGGSSTSCGIPFGPATAAMINFAVVTPAGLGHLGVTPFPAPVPFPTTSIINYTAGSIIANGLAVTMCDPAVTVCTKDITVQTSSATQLVADVQGYFKLLPTTLASGHTMTGNFVAGVFASVAGGDLWGSISFPIPLASAPAAPGANFIPPVGPSTTNCPGTFASPQAAPGQLCLYAAALQSAGFACMFKGTGACNSADTTGAGIWLISSSAGNSFCYGSWAVTAP